MDGDVNITFVSAILCFFRDKTFFIFQIVYISNNIIIDMFLGRGGLRWELVDML